MQYFSMDRVTKHFKERVALEDVSVSANEPTIIGLVGKNGSGKTTLLRHLIGLYLPTSGRSTTLGCDAADIGARELARIGMVHQHDVLLSRMTGEQFLRFVADFYATWDRELERLLTATLEVDVAARIGTMSTGNRQKLALLAATCHHPALVLLDEPLSDLDPIARAEVLKALLDRFRGDDVVMVVSSHLLHDVERIADRIVCLDRGLLIADAPLDELKDRFVECILTSREGTLPDRFTEPFVASQEGDGHRARVVVSNGSAGIDELRARYVADCEVRPLNLDRVFRALVQSPAGGPDTPAFHGQHESLAARGPRP